MQPNINDIINRTVSVIELIFFPQGEYSKIPINSIHITKKNSTSLYLINNTINIIKNIRHGIK